MTVYPCAKINIGLDIIRKREDGFHDIETVFYPVRLFDTVTFLEGCRFDWLDVLGIQLPEDGKRNLVLKALDILRKDFKIPDMRISLVKKIPFGAGLGGGSSDAAFFLKGLNEFFKLNLTREQLIEKASVLGSDCAFFIDAEPKFASGRGEIMTSAPALDEKYKIAVIKPDFEISTAFAYSKVKPQKPETSLFENYLKPVEEWKSLIKNDFEKFLFPYFPELEKLKKRLYDCGAVYASMTGSGSALFAIYDENAVFDSKIQKLRVL